MPVLRIPSHRFLRRFPYSSMFEIFMFVRFSTVDML